MPTSKKLKREKTKYIVPGIIFIQFLIITVLGYFVYVNWLRTDELSTIKISNLIITAVEYLTRPIPSDPKNGVVYVPEAHLELPAPPDNTYYLYYNYSPTIPPDSTAEVRLINRQDFMMAKSKVLVANNLDGVFDAVPEMQACTRGYRVLFSPDKTGEAPEVFQKKLTDGRTVYVYKEKACSATSFSMIPYLKQIESY